MMIKIVEYAFKLASTIVVVAISRQCHMKQTSLMFDVLHF